MNDWKDLCCKHITQQIDKLKKDKLNLYVPRTSNKSKHRNDDHYHTTPEMVSQMKGRLKFNFIGPTLNMVPSDICLIPAMWPHHGIPQSEPALSMCIAFEHFDLSLIRVESNTKVVPHSTQVLTIKTNNKNRIKEYINHIYELSRHHHVMRDSAIQGLLLACFSELKILLDDGESKIMTAHHPHPKISQALSLIEANLGNSRLNVAFLGELIGCNPAYLSQLFIKEIHIKLSSYINKMRLKQSELLLKETTLGVAEIAYACGYSDPNYFIRLFRNHTGLTPLQYKKH
jgi:YesN/AraC family two-component response regulator